MDSYTTPRRWKSGFSEKLERIQNGKVKKHAIAVQFTNVSDFKYYFLLT